MDDRATNTILRRHVKTYKQVSRELVTAVRSIGRGALLHKLACIITPRCLQLPRPHGQEGGTANTANNLRQPSGFNDLREALQGDDKSMRSGANKDHAIVNKAKLGDTLETLFGESADCVETNLLSLVPTQEMIAVALNECLAKHERKIWTFHVLQLACDLFSLRLVEPLDGCHNCTATMGSNHGLQYLRHYEKDQGMSLRQAAQIAGICQICAQSALCEYSTVMSWSCSCKSTRLCRRGSALRRTSL